MSITMKPDDAMAFREALEQITLKMVGVDGALNNGNEIVLASIAISLKRIADAADKHLLAIANG